MTKTENYQLNQWESSDRVLREDFNENNAKLDSALQSIANAHGFVTGSYTGGSTAGGASKVTIQVGFRPSLVLIFAMRNINSGNVTDTMGLIGIDGYYLRVNRGGSYVTTGLSFSDSGFSITSSASDDYGSNKTGLTYRYVAFH